MGRAYIYKYLKDYLYIFKKKKKKNWGNDWGWGWKQYRILRQFLGQYRILRQFLGQLIELALNPHFIHYSPPLN